MLFYIVSDSGDYEGVSFDGVLIWLTACWLLFVFAIVLEIGCLMGRQNQDISLLNIFPKDNFENNSRTEYPPALCIFAIEKLSQIKNRMSDPK